MDKERNSVKGVALAVPKEGDVSHCTQHKGINRDLQFYRELKKGTLNTPSTHVVQKRERDTAQPSSMMPLWLTDLASQDNLTSAVQTVGFYGATERFLPGCTPLRQAWHTGGSFVISHKPFQISRAASTVERI